MRGKGGVGAGTLVVREADYFAPVCDHFGHNHLPAGVKKACDTSSGELVHNPCFAHKLHRVMVCAIR